MILSENRYPLFGIMLDIENEEEYRLMSEDKKKVLIKTFGCQMNVYDSERMADVLLPVGYEATEEAEDADLIVLNTCHIREKAAEKVYSELGRLRKLKSKRSAEGKETLVAVAGCVAQAEGKEIASRAPVVDLVVGPQSYHRLPSLLEQVGKGKRQLVETDFPEEDKFKSLPHVVRKRAPTAFLTVQEGCDKFCTFCVVPYTRGVEFSRPMQQIVDEAEGLVSEGVRELTLLGQNVNAYHGAGPEGQELPLSRLIERLSEIDDLQRIRYMTSHPADMGEDLIEAHGRFDKLMPYLHLPFQAGADKILAAMNRKHTAESYVELIGKIRDARPDIALSTDIIVGFPGETEDDFEQTLEMVRNVTFAQAYSFKYSPRPGTPAASMEQVDDDVRGERLQRLQALLKNQQTAFNESCVGNILPVLVDKLGREPGEFVGRSPYLQLVHIEGDEAHIGDMVDVTIRSGGPNSLKGVIKTDGSTDSVQLGQGVYA